MKKVNANIYSDEKHNPIRYRLGHMDLYSAAVMETCMENASFFRITLKEKVNGDKLFEALKAAIPYFPLFGCSLIYDKEFYLEENHGDLSKAIKNVRPEERPLVFGSKNTTGAYMFQLCYFENIISFEWSHSVSDGKGSLAFVSKIMDAYFDVDLGPIPGNFPLTLPFETIYDPNVKPFGQTKQENGFKKSSLEVIPNGYKCLNHVIKLKTSDILAFGKSADSTPATILAPLFCKAIRMHLPEDCKNKNVSCGIVVDGRKPLGIETMHNCIFNKVITYTDKLDSFNLMKQSTLYRSILDIFSQPENLIACGTGMINQLDSIYRLHPEAIRKKVMKAVAFAVKDNMNNTGITYVGKIPFSDKVKTKVSDFYCCSWPDIGHCVMAVNDFNDVLTIVISENYKDKGIVETFINLCRENGLNVTLTEEHMFEQANVRI